jgi:hypothetical protein
MPVFSITNAGVSPSVRLDSHFWNSAQFDALVALYKDHLGFMLFQDDIMPSVSTYRYFISLKIQITRPSPLITGIFRCQ